MARSILSSALLRFAPAAAALALAAPAHGAILRYDFGGVITQADPTAGLSVGERFAGTLLFNTEGEVAYDVPNTEGRPTSEYSYSGTHRFSNPGPDGSGLEVRVGGRSLAPASTGVSGSYTDMRNSDGSRSPYAMFSGHLSTSNSPGVLLRLVGRPGLGFDTLPLGRNPAGLTLDQLASATILVEKIAGGEYIPESETSPFLMSGNIDTLTVTAVPEPAWTVAVLMGAAFWAVRRRKAG